MSRKHKKNRRRVVRKCTALGVQSLETRQLMAADAGFDLPAPQVDSPPAMVYNANASTSQVDSDLQYIGLTVVDKELIIIGSNFDELRDQVRITSDYEYAQGVGTTSWYNVDIQLTDQAGGVVEEASLQFFKTDVDRIKFVGLGGDDVFVNEAHVPSQAYGGEGNDFLAGGTVSDQLFGEGGDDTLYGDRYIASELIHHGAADLVDGGAGDDKIYGGQGHDVLVGGAGSDLIKGEWDDHFATLGATGRDMIWGDQPMPGNNPDIAIATDGDDIIVAGPSDDLVYGGGGNDMIVSGKGDDVLYGGAGNDHLIAGNGDDVLQGNSGHDRLEGGYGHDDIEGNAGNDILSGGFGNDVMQGGDGHDSLKGHGGNDNMHGDSFKNSSDSGNDTIKGGSGHDFIYGGRGNDRIWGDSGNDVIRGQRGRDTIRGGSGNDILDGGRDSDTLLGEAGADQLFGRGGIDFLFGGDNNDILDGGDDGKRDRLNGGSGRDTYVRHTHWGDDDPDRFLNFEDGIDLVHKDSWWSDFGTDIPEYNYDTGNRG